MKTPSRHSRAILITGITSGFGLRAAAGLLTEGYTVLALMRGGEERLRRVLPQWAEEIGKRLFAFECDLSDPSTIPPASLWTDRILSTHGLTLHAVIQNAGYGLFGNIEDQTSEQFRRQFEVNVFSPVFLTRALLPRLRADRGRLIFVSSVVGLYTLPFYGAYSATKHALEAWAEALAYELAAFGVQVALVEPGGFKTEFAGPSKTFAGIEATSQSPYAPAARALDRTITRSSGRLGDPDRVARLLVRLCTMRRMRRLRYLIGVDAWLLHVLARLLPDSWRLRAVQWVFRYVTRVGRA